MEITLIKMKDDANIERDANFYSFPFLWFSYKEKIIMIKLDREHMYMFYGCVCPPAF